MAICYKSHLLRISRRDYIFTVSRYVYSKIVQLTIEAGCIIMVSLSPEYKETYFSILKVILAVSTSLCLIALS